MASEDPPARANPARGLALIATALILGIFVLRQGFDTTDDLAAGAADTGEEEEEEAPPDEGDDEAAADEQEEAPPEPRSPDQLTVRVANTAGVAGAAAEWTDNIKTNGYKTTDATNAEDPDPATTAIVYADGLEAEATALAEALGDPGQIQLRPQADAGELTSTNGEPLMGEDVQLVVLLGQDLASQAGG